MAVTEAVENYLETILILSDLQKDVRAIDICSYLGYSRPTVSVILKKMKEEELLIIDERNCVTLTDKGKAVAERVYERHNIISELLIKLGVHKNTAFSDACKLEHDLSDESFEAIKNYYNKIKS